jgi:hypothetical protein
MNLFNEVEKAILGTDYDKWYAESEIGKFEKRNRILDEIDEANKGQDHDHDENCEPESCPDVKPM